MIKKSIYPKTNRVCNNEITYMSKKLYFDKGRVR